MAQGNNKPDLSDLKARLGLKKPNAATTNEQPQESAPAQAQPGPADHTSADGPGPAARPPAQAGGGPAASGPASQGPPAASGPPPGAQRPPTGRAPAPASARPAPTPQPARSPQPQTSTASEPSSTGASSRPSIAIDLDDDDLKAAGSTFSPILLLLFAVILVVGLLFGWVASSSLKNRDMYNAQSQDAARIQKALKPKLANLEKTKNIVNKLSPTKVDFDAAKKLASMDIAPNSNMLGGNRLLLGPAIINNVTQYTVDATMLQQMLKEHDRLTNQVDKKELEQLMKDNKVLNKDHFAVLFDYDYLAQKSGSDSYVPKKGRLVTVTSLEKDKDGKISVQMLGSDRTVKTHIQGIMPLDKTDMLNAQGPNALERYRRRVARIKQKVKQFDQYQSSMTSEIKKLASRDAAPLISF